MPYYKIAYSIAFVVILSAIQPVVYANEIGQAVERAVSLLAVVFCADTYLVEVQSKRSEVFCLYNLKKQAGVVYKRLFVTGSLSDWNQFVGIWTLLLAETGESDRRIRWRCLVWNLLYCDSRNCFVLECAFRNCQHCRNGTAQQCYKQASENKERYFC